MLLRQSHNIFGLHRLILVLLVLGVAAFFIAAKARTASMEPSHQQASQQSTTAPSTQPTVDFSGRVIHFTAHVYNATSSAAGSAPMVSDVWIQVGPNNEPLRERATTTLNGSFNQATFYDFTHGTRTFISATPFHSIRARGDNGCLSQGEIAPSSLDKYQHDALPFYTSGADLISAGFTQTTATDFEPVTPSKTAFGSPITTIGQPVGVEYTKDQLSADGSSQHIFVNLDEGTGLVLGWASATVGGSRSDNKEIRSPVEVFDSTKIPNGFFDATQFSEGC